jgi:hypothetical protein
MPSFKQQVVKCSPLYCMFSGQRNRERNLRVMGRPDAFRMSACSQSKTDWSIRIL